MFNIYSRQAEDFISTNLSLTETENLLKQLGYEENITAPLSRTFNNPTTKDVAKISYGNGIFVWNKIAD
jgi:hypothetical protein